jgi:hypothetical protein
MVCAASRLVIDCPPAFDATERDNVRKMPMPAMACETAYWAKGTFAKAYAATRS